MAEEDACVEEIFISIGLHQVRFKNARMRLLLRARLQLARRASVDRVPGRRVLLTAAKFLPLRAALAFSRHCCTRTRLSARRRRQAPNVSASAPDTRTLSLASPSASNITVSARFGDPIRLRTSPTR